MMIRENWGELLEPFLRDIFDKAPIDMPDYVKTLFNVDKSKKAIETNLGVGGLGLMDDWEDTNRQVSYEDIYKGFMKQYIHKKYSKGLEIERELVEDDQYGEIKKRTAKLSRVVYHTIQTHGAGVFNNAFNANIAGPDGQPLCSAAHPQSPNNATTYSNFGALELTADNLEAVRTAMMQWRDDKGNLLAMNPDCLIVPPAQRKPALVIADSKQEPDTAENNVNIWHGSVEVIEHRFLTDPTAWFVVDKARMKDFLNWFNRRVPKLEGERETFDSEVSKYKVIGRWSYGYDDASWVYGCRP